MALPICNKCGKQITKCAYSIGVHWECEKCAFIKYKENDEK